MLLSVLCGCYRFFDLRVYVQQQFCSWIGSVGIYFCNVYFDDDFPVSSAISCIAGLFIVRIVRPLKSAMFFRNMALFKCLSLGCVGEVGLCLCQPAFCGSGGRALDAFRAFLDLRLPVVHRKHFPTEALTGLGTCNRERNSPRENPFFIVLYTLLLCPFSQYSRYISFIVFGSAKIRAQLCTHFSFL